MSDKVYITDAAKSDFKEYRFTDKHIQEMTDYLNELVLLSPVIDVVEVSSSDHYRKKKSTHSIEEGHFFLFLPSRSFENKINLYLELRNAVVNVSESAQNIAAAQLRAHGQLTLLSNRVVPWLPASFDSHLFSPNDPLHLLGLRSVSFTQGQFFKYLKEKQVFETDLARLARLSLFGFINAYEQEATEDPKHIDLQVSEFKSLAVVSYQKEDMSICPAALSSNLAAVFRYWLQSYMWFGDPFSPTLLESYSPRPFVFQSPLQVFIALGMNDPKHRARLVYELEIFRLWVESTAIGFWEEVKSQRKP